MNTYDNAEVTIAVMGATGSGKTTFINIASGSNLAVGGGLQSCTSEVQIAQSFELDGRSVTLIDTPGFDDTTRSDAEILRMIAVFLATAYENGKRLAGVIYIHRISDFRMTGISSRNFKMFRELCGESTLRNVVILTNMWGEVSRDVGEAREQELANQDMFFKPVLQKGALLLRHENTHETAHNVLRRIIENHPVSLQIQRELIDEGKDISQTAAGAELNRELMEQAQKHQQELTSLQEEVKEAIRAKDEERRQELKVETKKLQTVLDRVQNESVKLASEYNEEKSRMAQQIQEISESSRRVAERAAAEYNQRLSEVQDQITRTSSIAMQQTVELQRHIDGLQKDIRRTGGGFFGRVGRSFDRAFRF